MRMVHTTPIKLAAPAALRHPDASPALRRPDAPPALKHPDAPPALRHPDASAALTDPGPRVYAQPAIIHGERSSDSAAYLA